jgi:hypothetical protein
MPVENLTIRWTCTTGQRRRNIDNWGGGQIFIYSCSAQLISFEIDCFNSLWTRIYEYLPPPNYRYSGASATGPWWTQQKHAFVWFLWIFALRRLHTLFLCMYLLFSLLEQPLYAILNYILMLTWSIPFCNVEIGDRRLEIGEKCRPKPIVALSATNNI